MKKIFLFVLFFCFMRMFTGNLYATECICPSNPCYNFINPCNCSTWAAWAQKTYYYMIPDFPLCTLTVVVCYRQCLDPNVYCVEHDICDLSVLNTCGTACDPWITYMNNGQPLEVTRKWLHLKADIERFISYQWFDEFVRDHPGLEIPCDALHERVKVMMLQTSCTGVCLTQYPISEPDTKYKIKYISCSTDFCCQISEIFCLNPDGSVNYHREVNRNGAPVCAGVIPPPTNCEPGENVTVYPCLDPCEDY